MHTLTSISLENLLNFVLCPEVRRGYQEGVGWGKSLRWAWGCPL